MTRFTANECAHMILVFILCEQKPPINANADISSKARCFNFGLSLHLHPYFVYASSESSGECISGMSGLP